MLILLFLFATVLMSCSSDTVWTESPECERLYAAVTGNSLLPPDGFSVTLDGVSPRLSWTEREGAVGYRIYRAAGTGGEWQAVHSVPVTGSSYTDSEISLLTHSGIWRYAAASVNEAGRESFRSREAAVTVYAPDFDKTVRVLSASAGGYPSGEAGSDSPVSAVRIAFEALNEAVSYAVLRKEAGKGSLLLTENAEVTVSEESSSGTVLFFYDETAQPGTVYSYRIVPVDALGRFGRESEPVEGFIFPNPQTGAWDVSAEKASLRILIPQEFRAKVTGFDLRFFDPKEKLTFSFSRDLRYEFSDTVVLDSGEIALLLKGKDSRWLNACIAAVFGDGDGIPLHSGFSAEQSVLFFSPESASLPVPSSVTVVHGERLSDGNMKTPVILKWSRQSDVRIRGYRIYRTDRLLFSEGTDKSEWGDPVADICVADFTDLISWSDNRFPRFGAFYYKINPYADENTETENNQSVRSFACAAVFPSDSWPLSASYREMTDAVRLRWPAVSGIDTFHFHCYPKQIGSDIHIRFGKADIGQGGEQTFRFLLTTPGEAVFRFEPVAVFTDGTAEIGSAVGPSSVSVTGAVELETAAWVRLIMETVAESQRKIGPEFRKNNEQQNLFQISFYRRKSPYLWSNNYDLFGFKKVRDKYDSVEISGTLAHIYYEKNGTAFCFSYSVNLPMPMSASVLKNIDKTVKSAAALTVSGVYPGRLYIWGRNSGKEMKDSAPGLLPANEFPNPAQFPYLNDFASDYGFRFSYPQDTSFRGESTYGAVRDGKKDLESVFYSEIGSAAYL